MNKSTLKLSVKFSFQLTPDDNSKLIEVASKLGITPGQLVRYWTRKGITESLRKMEAINE